ncbi:bifunctional 23S rRNA (guanine(2069)-N(7))-methyltransferase RlmK/23S rRNA (guanine(2445)-N(2))-methyltransferase RlmL [Carnimonas bestiolae]|uniref:bifunctional 23S rRNA (guanine(2069)-N(7))-methyltransferase RlmK/23S rRNA (guanine(2445)-N(2))-methyltransferase RlmL n=1 Tax=Carnimonas bestiolae TaxID=3402172 RepID=UPI003EDC369B
MTSSNSLAFFATCPRGIEQLLASELTALDAAIDGTTVAGVSGHATLEVLYACCLHSRLANRIIMTLGEAEQVSDADALYKAAIGVDWPQHISGGATLRVDFHGQSEAIRHTRFGAQVIKDAVVDSLQRAGEERPRVELQAPEVRIYAHLHRERLMIGLDLSGDSLHMRGYRLEGGKAPLKENLAAALLIRAGWPERAAQGEVLVDPMCGSGTLLIEAALMAADIAPNLWRRRFGFHGWKQHQEQRWQQVLGQARERATRGKSALTAAFVGQDADALALEAAGANARRAGVDQWLTLSRGDVARLKAPAHQSRGLIITNPPYGERIGDVPALIPLYQALGERMRSEFGGWRLALFTGNPELGHRTGLKAHKQYALRNGAIDCKLLLIDVYGRDERDARGMNNEGAAQEASAGVSHSEGAQMFANRLRKNKKRLGKWLKRSGTQCYRLYDADMPEYALAVDIYGSWVHVQEYAPPRSIDARSAERRLHEALGVLPEVLEVASDRIFLKTRQRQTGKSQYQRHSSSQQRFQVEEEGAKLWVNLRDYLDTGLFLDHRPVRRKLKEMAQGKRFLNLFCYTGTATVQAALGGARESISVDMSNTYLEWAADNFALNRLHQGRHTVVREDCFEWLKRERSYFDLIFLDPPTFSNSSKMSSTLDIQRDHVRLVELCMARLAPAGTLVFSNNQRKFKLDPELAERFDVEDISRHTIDPDFERRPGIHHVFEIRKKNA